MKTRVAIQVLALLLMSVAPVAAADPPGAVEAAALDHIGNLANISAADPAEAERFGFQSADELDRVQVLDVFEVNVLDPAIYTDSERLSAFDRLQGTDLWWVVIGVDGTARTVVTVQTAGDAASAVGVGWVPASELLDAMTAAGAAGRAVWIPEYASAVVARTAAGVVVRPLLTDVSSVHVGVARGDTVTGSEYAELLLEHHRAIGGASEQDGAPLGGGISPATPEPSFPPIAVTLIAILAVGVLFARLVVRTGR